MEQHCQKPALKSLTVEDYKRAYQDLIAGKQHGLNCRFPCCLYPYRHKNCKLGKENFFLGWLLLRTEEKKEKRGKVYYRNNWKLVEDLLNQICPEKFPKLLEKKDDILKGNSNVYLEEDDNYYKETKEKYRIATRCKNIVFNAWIRKLRIIRKLRKPETKRRIIDKGYYRAIGKCMLGDEKLATKIFRYSRSRKEVSTRELERKFSISRNDLDFILSFYEDEWTLSRKGKQEFIIFIGKDRLIHPREIMIEEFKESLILLGTLKNRAKENNSPNS